MWVFIRPRGGQESYLLVFESRGRAQFCPIHRFDTLNQIPRRERVGTAKMIEQQATLQIIR